MSGPGRQEQIDAIQSSADLARFVASLADEIARDPEAWENNDLPSFLEAMAAWIIDLDSYYRNRGQPAPEQPTWKVLADILTAATMYE